ncbi:hypothetical protein SS50377_23787 [Spironucleus salmonicida]|uniref:Uncharacterized protein n=1 Tax=Spironucleus salmonicida TaxID=348837 RepID=V6LPC9_9EUKA|nr:hypothetical protein SS50377_23787 [Spironucleus salmonicida]|eukprot:EST46465.1 Hypothetical protein SS50377_13547 [Spironucleus salmonicida]
MNYEQASKINTHLLKIFHYNDDSIFTELKIQYNDQEIEDILFLSTVLKTQTRDDYEFLVSTLDLRSSILAIKYFGYPGIILCQKLQTIKDQPYKILNIKKSEFKVEIIQRNYNLLKDQVTLASKDTVNLIAPEIYVTFLKQLSDVLEKSYQSYRDIQ